MHCFVVLCIMRQNSLPKSVTPNQFNWGWCSKHRKVLWREGPSSDSWPLWEHSPLYHIISLHTVGKNALKPTRIHRGEGIRGDSALTASSEKKRKKKGKKRRKILQKKCFETGEIIFWINHQWGIPTATEDSMLFSVSTKIHLACGNAEGKHIPDGLERPKYLQRWKFN